MQKFFVFFFLVSSISIAAQKSKPSKTKNDTISVKKSPFKTGFYPLGFFDVDLRYFVKYNNYEGMRLGFGGITNQKLFKNVRLGGYMVHGFIDRKFKYSFGGGIKLEKKNKTWLNAYYTNDISEMGSFTQLTDKLVYSLFEPRLVNIIQFYKHKTWQSNLQHQFGTKILSEFRISHSIIDQILDYYYIKNNLQYTHYKLSEITASFRWNPKTKTFLSEEGVLEYYDGIPNISFQVTQGIKNIFKSDFNYTKFGLKLDYLLKQKKLASTHLLFEAYYEFGEAPLTHLFHASPNSPTKNRILKRFSVAGRNSFETMYFGEFFSDRLAIFQAKHTLRRFYISKKIKPELAFITKHALGDLRNKNQHQGITFNTLNQIYNESGIELNKIFFGFGLNFSYRYGFYHLPEWEDNISFKFTFYLKL